MSASPAAQGPHSRLAGNDPRERFTAEIFDRLWDQYRRRVSYVAAYEKITADAGATFVNDHIAFRTLARQQPTTGIASISRVFEALGYRAAGCYTFPDKHLGALHFEHANRDFPKLFISELKTWELSREAQERIHRTLASHREPLSDATLARLIQFDEAHRAELMTLLLDWLQTLPWQPPEQEDVAALSAESQYAAWTLIHGYNVNHFTSLINSHATPALDDIEKTSAALQRAGVPMKAEIEGAPGSKLRQTATEAVTIEVEMCESGRPIRVPWTYAYFELAQRGEVMDAETGRPTRFEGFLGPQATQLFEMTRVKS